MTTFLVFLALYDKGVVCHQATVLLLKFVESVPGLLELDHQEGRLLIHSPSPAAGCPLASTPYDSPQCTHQVVWTTAKSRMIHHSAHTK